jgi:hypothetical protein
MWQGIIRTEKQDDRISELLLGHAGSCESSPARACKMPEERALTLKKGENSPISVLSFRP